MSKRRKIALLVIVCVQLAVPLGMAGLAEADLAFGDEIKLRAQPVDPLDIFRGNYVVLRYEISRLPGDRSRCGGANGSAPTSSSRRRRLWSAVRVRLPRRSDGK